MANQANPAVAAIKFALQTSDGINFLYLWDRGDFARIRRNWPEAPEDIYPTTEVKE